jgi:anti-sigma factor RsiW
MGDCEKLRAYLADYRTGSLGEGKCRWMDDHLSHCPDCARELKALDDVLALVSSNIPIYEPPVGLWNGVYNRITSEPERRRFAGLIRAAGAATAVVVLAAGLILSGVGRHNVAPVQMAANDEYVQGHVLYAGEAPFADRVSYLSVVAASESGGSK